MKHKFTWIVVVAAFALTGCNDDTVRTEITDAPLPMATSVTETTAPAAATVPPVVEPAAVPVVPRGTRTLKPVPTVVTPAPTVTRRARPAKPTPIVVPVDVTPAVPTEAPAPVVTANPRPVDPTYTLPVETPPGPLVTRGTRDLADPPVVVLPTCPEEDPESCPPQP